MDSHEVDLIQQVVCELKNTNKYIELSLQEIEEIITALDRRMYRLGKMGAKKRYLYLLHKIKNKLQK